VELKVSAPKRAIIATIDQTQIRQLLLNLVLNALDALNEGGRIELSLDAEAPQPINGQLSLESVAARETNGRNPISRDPQSLIDTQRFQAPSPTGWFSIIISDNGPGIPPEMLPSIFEPFVTTKETGTGLGLSICRRIAEAHQGTLNAVNRPEGGASFILSLPYDL
jgi:signal transduction histidine kinase